MRSGASDVSSKFHVRALGRSPPETRYTTSAPAFVRIPHWSFNLDGRRLSVDQFPHFQHHNVPSRNPYWCERCTERRPKGASPRSRGDLGRSRARGVLFFGSGVTTPSDRAAVFPSSIAVHAAFPLALLSVPARPCSIPGSPVPRAISMLVVSSQVVFIVRSCLSTSASAELPTSQIGVDRARPSRYQLASEARSRNR